MRKKALAAILCGTIPALGWGPEGHSLIARIAEAGKFDLLFISDSMVMEPTDHPSFMCRFEPTTLITVLSASTSHIGLGATVSSSFSEPFNVARVFGSIDHISNGRAAWNVVTSSNPKAALNFNRTIDRGSDTRQRSLGQFHSTNYQMLSPVVPATLGPSTSKAKAAPIIA